MSKHLMITLMASAFLLAAGCGQGFTTQRSSELPVKTVYTPSSPVVKKIGNYSVVEGALTHSMMNIAYDTVTRYMALKGNIELQDIDSGSSLLIELEMQGMALEGADTIVLKSTGEGAALPHGVEVGAKATCMGVDGDCTTSFVDIFVQYKNKYYHLQVETTAPPADPFQKEEVKPSNEPAAQPSQTVEPKKDQSVEPQKGEPKKDEPKKVQPQPTTPAVEEEEEHENDEDSEAVKGNYQGDIEGDIEELFLKKEKPDPKDPTQTPNLQNFGSVTKGRLEKPANLLSYTKTHDRLGLYVMRPERDRHYVTNELMAVILNLGRYTRIFLPSHTLAIGDISGSKGGQLSLHNSHQMGVDVDVAYFFKNVPKPKTFIEVNELLQGKTSEEKKKIKDFKMDPDFMVEDQWKLLKHVVSLQWTDRIFVHPEIKKAFCKLAQKNGELENDNDPFGPSETLRRLRPELNHGDHFHLRTKMRCNKGDRRCQPMAAPEVGTGCDKIKIS